jgi:hypothetical protein
MTGYIQRAVWVTQTANTLVLHWFDETGRHHTVPGADVAARLNPRARRAGMLVNAEIDDDVLDRAELIRGLLAHQNSPPIEHRRRERIDGSPIIG